VFIADLVGREQLLDANGKREAVDAVAEISGPALGGALVAWLTAPLAIAVDALTFAASALLIARIRKQETIVATSAASSFIEDVRIGIHVVWRDPAIRALFISAATMTLFGSFMASLLRCSRCAISASHRPNSALRSAAAELALWRARRWPRARPFGGSAANVDRRSRSARRCRC
jgi:hypothetical protein